jgi:hypothetical protein
MSAIEFEVWLNHFEYHADHPCCIPCELSDRLMPQEQRLIASSIATFQLRAKSAGPWLLPAAQRFAHDRRLAALVRIVELLIRDEQHHAALLQVFMEDHAIAVKKTHWTDAVFRRVRRLAGLESLLYVRINAELVGIVYFRALEAATHCQRLKVLCRVRVSDQLAHVGFESQVLFALRAGRASWVQALSRSAHRTWFAGAAGVVWFTHRAVLRRAGYGVRSFLSACLAQYDFHLEPVKGVALAWNDAEKRLDFTLLNGLRVDSNNRA